MKKPNGIKQKIDQHFPDIKRELVSEEAVGPEFEIKDSKGKAHKAQEVTRTEKEIDSVHLVKIAPMYYFCTDNNKVLMIPFSIQFSVEEAIKQLAMTASQIEKFVTESQTKHEGKDK